MTKGIHKHHLKPRHLGGTNDPSNLLEVTVDEHALIHEARWYAYHQWQDYVAWKALSGQIGKEEIQFLKNSLAHKDFAAWPKGKKRGPWTEERKKAHSLILKGKPKPPGFGEKLRQANLGKKRPWLSEWNIINKPGFKKGYTPWNKGMR
jgi:hypothetical protein